MARRVRISRKRSGKKNKLWENISIYTRQKRRSESENKRGRKRTSVARRISDKTVQSDYRYKKERIGFLVLPCGVPQADEFHQAVADEPTINIILPPFGLNLKPILMSLRWEIINGGITLAGKHNNRYRNNVIVPSLKCSFHIAYMDGYLLIGTRRSCWCKIPVAFEEDTIPETIIDIMVAFIEHRGTNGIIPIKKETNAYELSSILSDNDH